MKTVKLGKGTDRAFIHAVEEESGEELKRCYQCGNCSAGCPMTFTYDLQVNQIMRLLQLGQREAVLSCKSIWLCATCETCTVRCPNNIKVAKIMDVCRHMARREGYGGVYSVRVFADSFLQAVKWHGKAHELGLMAMFKMRTGKFLADLELAPGMLKKGKLPILPHRAQGHAEVAEIFRRYKEKSKS